MRRQLLIFTALHYEADAISKALRSLATSDHPADIRVHVVGPGATNFPSKPTHTEVSGVIMAGLGGGLDPSLKTGDVVVDESSVIAFRASGGLRRGRIQSAAAIVSTPEEKSKLFKETGALVVDMENAAARRLAGDWGVPFLGIRAVVDVADQTLDPALLRLTDSGGRLRRGRLLAEVFRRPDLLLTLWRTRDLSRTAMRALTCALNEIIQSGVFK